MERSTPSTSTRPEVGVWNAQTRPIIVDLPAPDGPTSAVTVPGAACERHALQDRLARSVGEAHVLEDDLAAHARRARPSRRGSSSSGRSRSTSRVRSSPARASVSCVPMETIWKNGATRKPRKTV